MSFLSKATSALGVAALPFVGSTALALGDTFYNDYSSRKAASRQNDYTWSLLNYQNDWNLQQWNRENEYNTPKNIMARYQEAGLNPNLIYGNAYQSPAHLESASGQAPQVRPNKSEVMSNMIHSVLSAYNLEAQNQLLKAQKDEVAARTGLIKKQTSNWDKDHTNYQREIIDLVRGIFGSDKLPGTFGGLDLPVVNPFDRGKSKRQGSDRTYVDFSGLTIADLVNMMDHFDKNIRP